MGRGCEELGATLSSSLFSLTVDCVAASKMSATGSGKSPFTSYRRYARDVKTFSCSALGGPVFIPFSQ